jgi:hypothetical protein
MRILVNLFDLLIFAALIVADYILDMLGTPVLGYRFWNL